RSSRLLQGLPGAAEAERAGHDAVQGAVARLEPVETEPSEPARRGQGAGERFLTEVADAQADVVQPGRRDRRRGGDERAHVAGDRGPPGPVAGTENPSRDRVDARA